MIRSNIIRPATATYIVGTIISALAVMGCTDTSLDEAPSVSCDAYAARIADLPISDINHYEVDGRRVASAVVHGDDADYELVGEWEDDDDVFIKLYEGDKVAWQVELTEGRFHVVSFDEGVAYTQSWARSGGDMVEFLDLWQPPGPTADPFAGPFVDAPLHRVGLRSMERVLGELGSDLSVARLMRASEAYALAVGGDADEARECMNLHARGFDPDGENGEMDTAADVTGGEECDIQDSKKATGGKLDIKLGGLADLVVIAAEVSVSAYCDEPTGCLQAKATSDFGSDTTIVGAGGGCPVLGDWEDPTRTERKLKATASVGDGCAMNGSKDTAKAFKATLNADAGFSAELTGPDAEGNGVGGSATLEGTAIVCYDDDWIWDDVSQVILNGSSTAEIH